MICSRCEEFKLLLAVEEYIVRSSPEKGSFLEKIFEELATNSKLIVSVGIVEMK